MADIEKVVKGLCEAIGIIHGYVWKRYWGYGEQACRDAIELLKEHEPVEPEPTEFRVFGSTRKCSNCGKYLFPAGRFCPHCGRSVKWE